MERIEAPQRLLVLGAVEDANPLVEMGALLGWTVEVADSRAQLGIAERFPRAHRTTVLRQGAELGRRRALRHRFRLRRGFVSRPINTSFSN